jgi:AcrR family transcriptional regulator
MIEQTNGTKYDLILAAGELFAKNGYDGTSIRAIAEKANANVAAINYHFGTKENLYAQAIHHAVKASGRGFLGDHIPDVNLENNEDLVAETVYRIVEERFKKAFSKGRPDWYDKIIMRALFEPPPSFEEIVKRSFQPDHESLKDLALRARPSLTDRQAHLWVLSVFGQLMIHTFAKDAILTILKIEDYNPEYIRHAVSHVAHVSVTALFSLPTNLQSQGDET